MVAVRKPSASSSSRVVWAEDALDDQFLIRHALNQVRDAPQVTFVMDGVAAIQEVQRQRPDLLVLDINMPRMDGLTALREVRERPGGADLPVVVFSTAREDGDLAVASTLGVRAFVQKPGPFPEFCAAVGAILQHAKPPVAAKGKAIAQLTERPAAKARAPRQVA